MATPVEVLTPTDLAHTGLPEDRLVALIEDAFATADALTGYRLSAPGFARLPQLRAVLRRAIEYYAEAMSKDPTQVTAGSMSVSYPRITPSSGFFTPDQVAQLVGLTAPPRRPVGTVWVGLP